jgi:hypothetical protein
MNARVLILAILAAVILLLVMTVYAPADEAIVYMTLGGDCSADRATGDLYHTPDPYCLVEEGNQIPVTALGVSGNRGGKQVVKHGQGLRLGYESTVKNDRSSDQDDDRAPASSNAPIDAQDSGASLAQIEPLAADNSTNDQIITTNNQDGGESSGDQIDNSTDNKDKEGPKDQSKDRGSADKECKKTGRDNVNSQGNHNCSGDNPDASSGQERTTDHGQSGQDQGGNPDKDKDKKDK